MNSASSLQPVISVLQTALTPAFLLVALGGLLHLFSGRLSRIVDRTRMLEDLYGRVPRQDRWPIVRELRIQEKRVVVVSASILLGVLASVAVCIMIGLLFLMGLWQQMLAEWVVACFLLSLGLLVASLLFYVREVQLATRCIHVRKELLVWPCDDGEGDRAAR